jgi:WD40 repeat protein
VDVLELPSGRRMHHWTGLPLELIYGLAYSPDGTKLAVLQRTWLTVLDATNGARVWSMARDVVGDRAAEAYTFAWHPRGDWLLVADKERSLSAWRLVPVPWRVFFGAQSEQPSCLLFGPDGDWFVSSSDAGESVVWNFHSMQPMLRLEGRYQATMLAPDRRRIG